MTDKTMKANPVPHTAIDFKEVVKAIQIPEVKAEAVKPATGSSFRALNPFSNASGVFYPVNPITMAEKLDGAEMYDLTVADFLTKLQARRKEGGAFSVVELLKNTRSAIMGKHYDAKLTGYSQIGALDWLVFPLIARKLILDTQLPEREKSYVTNALALAVGYTLELFRGVIGLGLTVLALPILPVVWAIDHVVDFFEKRSEAREAAELADDLQLVQALVESEDLANAPTGGVAGILAKEVADEATRARIVRGFRHLTDEGQGLNAFRAHAEAGAENEAVVGRALRHSMFGQAFKAWAKNAQPEDDASEVSSLHLGS